MSESVRTECEKSPDRHEETDKAFEEIFWCAGMRKAGKKNAASAFRTQFREWRKTTRVRQASLPRCWQKTSHAGMVSSSDSTGCYHRAT